LPLKLFLQLSYSSHYYRRNGIENIQSLGNVNPLSDLGKLLLQYEGAEHMVFLPYFITGQNRYMNGGNPKDDALGSVVSWEETIAFLHRHLE